MGDVKIWQNHFGGNVVSFGIRLLQVWQNSFKGGHECRVIDINNLIFGFRDVRIGDRDDLVDMWRKALLILIRCPLASDLEPWFEGAFPSFIRVSLQLSHPRCTIDVVIVLSESNSGNKNLFIETVHMWSGLLNIWLQVGIVVWLYVRSCLLPDL